MILDSATCVHGAAADCYDCETALIGFAGRTAPAVRSVQTDTTEFSAWVSMLDSERARLGYRGRELTISWEGDSWGYDLRPTGKDGGDDD